MEIVLIVSSLIVGATAGWFANQTITRKKLLKRGSAIIRQAEQEAEAIKKEKLLQAKEKFLELKNQHE
ncbi:Rnase Y domain-containing protein, partial [Schleiferia thermophila]